MADIKKIRIGSTVYNIKDLVSREELETKCEQLSIMPDTYEEGKIVQYVGDDTVKYTNGYFYKFVTHYLPDVQMDYASKPFTFVCNDPVAFSQKIASLIGGDPETFGEIDWSLTKSDFGDTWVIDCQGATDQILLPQLGIVITGAVIATGDIIRGRLYGPSQQEGEEVSEWIAIKGQATIEVINSLISYSKTSALSANQGRILKDAIDNISAIGRMLALWDAVDGEAKYMPSGVTTYQQGDYFVVSAVAEEGGTNYRPSGSSYAPSTTPETEPLMVSDMYFYNGEEWLLLPNSAKQIAIDDELSATSTNPVENRVITAKVNTIDSDIAGLQSQINNKQDRLSAGNGIVIENGYEISADTDVLQEKLNSGTNIKTINGETLLGSGDIVISGGGSGYPALATVSTKKYNADKIKDLVLSETIYRRGNYSDIVFTTNMDRATLITNMNDIYVGMYRHHSGYATGVKSTEGDVEKRVLTNKYSLMNDRRYQSTKTMYCWVICDDPDIDPHDGHFDPGIWYFYYTEDNYGDNVQDMLDDNPEAYTWLGLDTYGDYGSNFNKLRDSGNTMSDMTSDYTVYRMPEYDIDSFINVNQYCHKTTESKGGVVLGNKLECCECTKNGQRYFAWCLGWNYDEADTVLIDASLDPETIPERFDLDNVTYIDKTEFLDEYEVGKRRNDLDICDLSGEPIDDILSVLGFGISGDVLPLWIETDTDKPAGATERGAGTFKHAYEFDHPMKPIRLAECEVLIPDVYKDAEAHLSGRWIKFKEYIKLDTTKLSSDSILFRYPYPTDYIVLRFSGWEKECLTHPIYDKDGGVQYKDRAGTYLNYVSMGTESNPMGRKSYRSPGQNGRITENVAFGLIMCDDLIHSKVSKSAPIHKKLVSAVSGVTTVV